MHFKDLKIRLREKTNGVESFAILNPHPAEFSEIRRNDLNIYFSLPENGINSSTVPVLLLHGFFGEKLRAYFDQTHKSISKTHNILLITLDYFGSNLMLNQGNYEIIFNDLSLYHTNNHLRTLGYPAIQTMQNFPLAIPFKSVPEFLNKLPFRVNEASDIEQTPYYISLRYDDYNDYGYIQVMDCLWAINTLKMIVPNIDWKKLSVVGTSHGGYLATLCAKYAPNTFALVVDCIGYVQPPLSDVYGLPVSQCSADQYFFKMLRDNVWRPYASSHLRMQEYQMRIRSASDPQHISEWKNQVHTGCTHFIFVQHEDDYIHDRQKNSLSTLNS